MKWINPKIVLPIKGQIYLVLFKSSGSFFLGMATPYFHAIYNEETDEFENGKMGWKSLYAPTMIRAFNIEGSFIDKPRRRDIRNLCPIGRAIAYTLISDISYPNELIQCAHISEYESEE